MPLIGKTWVSGKWISEERGLRNNRRNRRWLALVDYLASKGFGYGAQERQEEAAWEILRVLDKTP
jgi:hypothetical protein